MSVTSVSALCMVIIVCFSSISLESIASIDDSADIGWGVATTIGGDDSGSALYPQVAMDGSGNAIAVWQQYDGVRSNIWSTRFTVEEGWGESVLIETDNSGDARNPQIAVDDSGNAIAVWQQNDGTRYCIYSNRYVAGVGWGSATPIESYDSEGAFNPQIAVCESGSATVVWEQEDGEFGSIHSNRYVAGTGWESAILIGSADDWWEANVNDPQLSVDSSGNAMAVWLQYGYSGTSLWSNRYEVGTGWRTATLIETEGSVSVASRPQVALDDSGNAIVVWSGSDGFRDNVCSNRYTVGNGWGDMTLLENDDVENNSAPHVAFDGSGNAIAVWTAWHQGEEVYPSYESGIKANRYVAGSGWLGATVVEDLSTGMTGSLRVAVNDLGNAVAVWHIDGDSTSICSSGYDVETGWGQTASIGTGDPLDGGDPQVDIDPMGNAMVVWWQYDVTGFDIWSIRYVAPDSSPSSPTGSVIAIFAILAVGSIAFASFFFLRKRKADNGDRSSEERPPPDT